MTILLTYDQIRAAIQNKGYAFFEDGAYDVNLYGIRNSSMDADEWNDVLGVAYKDKIGNKINLMHKGSTKPGLYWLKKKMGNLQGTAILIPGQYRGCWKIGEHKGYEALSQKSGVFRVWRDNDSDGKFDYSGKTYDDVTGLNMHTESLIHKTEKVGAYSAGCQVRADDLEHFMVMQVLKISNKIFGNSFSFTLLEERDFIN
jgi:hypothetical protein